MEKGKFFFYVDADEVLGATVAIEDATEDKLTVQCHAANDKEFETTWLPLWKLDTGK